MEIHAKAVYDKNTIKAFYKNLKYRRPFFIILEILVYISLVGAIVLGILNRIFVDNTSLDFILPMIVLVFWLLYRYAFIPWENLRISQRKSDSVNEYTFLGNKMTVVTNSKGVSGTSEYEYTVFYKVFETKEYIYMYISRSQVLIIDKSTITGGTVEQIRGAIMNHIGIKNYKLKK